MIKNILTFSVHNPLLISIVAVIIMVSGYYSYNQLPIDAFPDVSPKLVQVFTVTEGLGPEEIEKYVTFPIEASMNGLPGTKKIRSVSNFGLSVINIYFEDDVDIYFARQLVGERLTEAKEQIPKGFGEPEMGPISTGMGLILFYYLQDKSGKYTLEELRTIHDWVVKFNLQTINGVTEVLGIGGYEKQYHIIVDPNSLIKFNITIGQIIRQIEENNLNIGAQYIEKNNEEFVVRSIGLAQSIKDIEKIIIKYIDSTPIFLYQLAEVKVGGAIRRGLQTLNGTEEVIAGMVVKLYGENTSEVIERVEKKIAEINKNLPEGLDLIPYYEQKNLVDACIETVSSALVQGIILVVLVLFVFMGAIRPSLIVALSILFSVLFAMLGMWYFNISANLMSFGGLAIAIGMMVDGTIVMVENIYKKLKDGNKEKNTLSTVLSACFEVGQPIVFAIFIIILVFIPIFTLEGVEGKTFRPLGYTIALAMFGSLIFSLVIAPGLSKVLLQRSGGKKERRINFSEVIETLIIKAYSPILNYLVKNKILTVIISVFLIIIGIIFFNQLGSEFTPKLQEGTLLIRLTMSPSISIDESKRLTMIVEKRILKVPEVIKVVSRIGRGEVGAHADPINSAEMYVVLKPKDDWESADNQEALESFIRKNIGKIPGVMTNFTQPIAATIDELLEGVRAELAIKLFGDDLQLLKKKADEISDVVRKVKGARDIQVDQITGTPQLLIKINRDKIATWGLNVHEIQTTIRSAVGGEVAGQLFEGVKRFDILVRFPEKYRKNKEKIEEILITKPDNTRIPLKQLVDIDEIIGPRQITRENNQRFITIQCNVSDRDIVSFVTEAESKIDEFVNLPTGYHITWGGQYRLQEEANKRLKVVIPVTLLGIFILIFFNFHSLRNSLLILLNIPLALTGGIIALWLTGQNLSVPSSVGFIALFGIALENAMVLVSYINQLVKEGKSPDLASIEGAVSRLRAVLMTAATTSLGLIPLLLSTGTGSEVQEPLATVVIGGIITSTILTLFVLPSLYKWFAIKIK